MKAKLLLVVAVLGLAAGCTTPPKPMASKISDYEPGRRTYITGSRIPAPAEKAANSVSTVAQQVAMGSHQ